MADLDLTLEGSASQQALYFGPFSSMRLGAVVQGSTPAVDGLCAGDGGSSRLLATRSFP